MLLTAAEAVDDAADQQFKKDRRKDETSVELAQGETRLVKLRTAKEQIKAGPADKAQQAAKASGANVVLLRQLTEQRPTHPHPACSKRSLHVLTSAAVRRGDLGLLRPQKSQ